MSTKLSFNGCILSVTVKVQLSLLTPSTVTVQLYILPGIKVAKTTFSG